MTRRHDFGKRRQRDLLLGAADRAVGGAADALQPDHAAPSQHVEHGGGPTATRDQPNVGELIGQQRLDGIFVVVAHRSNDRPGGRVWSSGCQVERADDLFRLREIGPDGARMHGTRPVADRGPQPHQRMGSRCVAKDEEQRSWQLRIDENVERPGARAGTHVGDNTRQMLGRLIRRDLDQSRLPITDGDESFSPHQGFGTAAAHPAPELAIGGDERLVARPSRCGGLDPDDGCDDERLAALAQLHRSIKDLVRK